MTADYSEETKTRVDWQIEAASGPHAHKGCASVIH